MLVRTFILQTRLPACAGKTVQSNAKYSVHLRGYLHRNCRLPACPGNKVNVNCRMHACMGLPAQEVQDVSSLFKVSLNYYLPAHRKKSRSSVSWRILPWQERQDLNNLYYYKPCQKPVQAQICLQAEFVMLGYYKSRAHAVSA